MSSWRAHARFSSSKTGDFSASRLAPASSGRPFSAFCHTGAFCLQQCGHAGFLSVLAFWTAFVDLLPCQHVQPQLIA